MFDSNMENKPFLYRYEQLDDSMSDLESPIYIQNDESKKHIIRMLYEKYCCMCCHARKPQNIENKISYTFELDSGDEF